MKGIMQRMRKRGRWLTFLFAFVLLFGTGLGARAAEDGGEPYDADAKGSITVELSEQGGNRENVEVRLYKVGTLDASKGYLWFTLEDSLKEVEGVDLNNITTGEANIAAAEALLPVLEAGQAEPVSQWTDAQGVTKFEGLEQGMYLIAEGNPNAYGTFSPLVVPVPYADETSWDYDPAISPKADGGAGVLGRIDVTKKVKGITPDGDLQDVHATDATYYIGLFLDAAGTRPYGGETYYQPVHVMDGDSGTVSFSNIPVTEEPYYIFETDAEGNPLTYLEQQGTEDAFYCMAGETLGAAGAGTAPTVILGEENDSIGTATITNVYGDGLPDGYYYTGEITITKSVMNNGQMVASDDVFYAGVFPVDAQGTVSTTPVEIVKLNNNAAVTVEVPLGGTDGTEAITYAVRETNEQGVPVSQDSTFLYEVTGEANVALSLGQTTGTVNITNTLGAADGYYQEEPSTQASNDPGTGNANNRSNANDNGSNNGGNNSQSGGTSSGTGRSSSSARTGDDNQIFLYAGLLAAAVIVGGVVIVRRRRRTNG